MASSLSKAPIGLYNAIKPNNMVKAHPTQSYPFLEGYLENESPSQSKSLCLESVYEWPSLFIKP